MYVIQQPSIFFKSSVRSFCKTATAPRGCPGIHNISTCLQYISFPSAVYMYYNTVAIMNKCLVTAEDPQGGNILLQFTPCYMIAQQRHHSMNKTLAYIAS